MAKKTAKNTAEKIKRDYIGPPYKKGIVTNIVGLQNKPQDMKNWHAAKQERMIKKYPELSRYFSDPDK